MMKKIISYIVVFFIVIGAQAQDIPAKSERLVNDFANVLSSQEEQQLESELSRFARGSSTQIVVVTVESLNGYDISDFAFRLGEQWGVGQKGKDNGVVIIFKPKVGNSRGQVFVAVGYGLEGVIPDAVANRTIVQNEMIPRFKIGDTFGGLYAGSKVIMDLASGEYTADQYQQKASGGKGGFPFGVLFFLLFFIIIPLFRGRKNSYYSAGRRSSSLPFWLLMGGMMGSGHRSGSWNNFNSGSGSFGGGGGFGGFGGGGFGGGGAGGSW